MCNTQNKDALRNGHAGDPVVQGHALADLLDSNADILARLEEMPTRTEVREMVRESLAVHVETCSHARKAAGEGVAPEPEENKFEMLAGKFGFKAEGRTGVLAGMLLGMLMVIIVWKVAPFIASWLGK